MKRKYYITSERADRRADEWMNEFISNNQYQVGDVINLDGIKWTVEQVGEPVRRVWTEQEIRDMVQKNDKVLYGALRNLYAEQTADEKMAGETKVKNGKGFNGLDAEILTSFAKFLGKTGFLTDKQKIVARRKMVKYTKQLTKLANA